MKKILLFISCLFLCSLSIQAQKNNPYSEVKGKRVISEFHSLDKPSTSQAIFLNALLWVINKQELPQEEGVTAPVREVDYDNQQLSAEFSLISPKTESCYRYIFTVKVSDNIITLLASDITQEAAVSVIKITKKLNYNKLQPEKKPKHQEYMDEFASLYADFTKEILQAVSNNVAPVVTHWTEIKNKEVVKGMNEAECLMAWGKPISMQTNGNKTEWMYDSYTYAFFENGVVTTIIK